MQRYTKQASSFRTNRIRFLDGRPTRGTIYGVPVHQLKFGFEGWGRNRRQWQPLGVRPKPQKS